MEGYLNFNLDLFIHTLQSWMHLNANCVVVSCGFLHVESYYIEPYSALNLQTSEGDEAQPGSFRWFHHKFFSVRCLYGIVRNLGLINWEWELSDDFMAMGRQWYEEMILMYTPFMRMKVQHTGSFAICVINLYSNTFMKLYPIFPPPYQHQCTH